VALDEVIAGAYNTSTASGFSTPPLMDHPYGFTGEEIDEYMEGFGDFETSEAEYSWEHEDCVLGQTKAMVMMFTTSDVQIAQIGGLGSGQGANVLGSGGSLDQIPVLVPVVPEPASLTLLAVGGTLLLHRRRRVVR
jgi:hypothetical protein